MNSSIFLQYSIISQIVTDTCPEYNPPPNVTITYTRTADTNGRYSGGTMARASCDQGFQIYGDHSLFCSFGSWAELVYGFECVPNNQGELSLITHWLECLCQMIISC